MDPVGVALAIPGLIVLCAQVVSQLKKVIETFATAARTLVQLLARAERMRMFLEAIKGLIQQMKSHDRTILLNFNESGYKSTLDKLDKIIRGVAGHKSAVLMRASWMSPRGKATELLGELRGYENELTGLLVLVNTYVYLPGCRLWPAEDF
jgi:hypothetical protein